MLKSILALTLLATSAHAASCGGLTFTAPTVGTICTAGNNCPVQWTGKNNQDADAAFKNEDVKLELVYGDTNTVVSLGTLAKPKAKDGSYTFIVPKDIPNGVKYALRANSSCYTPSFTIQNPNANAASGDPTTYRLPQVASAAFQPESSMLAMAVALVVAPFLVQ